MGNEETACRVTLTLHGKPAEMKSVQEELLQ